MGYTKLPQLDKDGFVVLKRLPPPDPAEWQSLEFMDWKSSGDTEFAPIASALGEMECRGFWDAGKPDKGGVWTKNAAVAPTMVDWVKSIGADYGRVRVIKLNPTQYEETQRNLHQDDNNRLNPDGSGWVVRAFWNLTDNPDSFMVLREDKYDPSTESRVPLPAGAMVLIDTERLFHAVAHPADSPRYCLITSFESGPELERWVEANLDPDAVVVRPDVDDAMRRAAEEVRQRDLARAAAKSSA